MQYIPGSSVTLSASLSYLAKNIPDDSDLETRIPQICVDYLSHEWLEEDVWKSWRNMTRHKNEVANGVRLENASWRTWWKQRNKLKTISPETLNWLKDSDVTWLYGPLHTAAEPVPKPKQSTYVDRYNLEKASGKKPILKHRTIAELLNLPPGESTAIISPPPNNLGSPSLEAAALDLDPNRSDSPRPTIPHTRSDSIINRRGVTLPNDVGMIDTTSAVLQRVASISTPPRSGSPATQSDRLSVHGLDNGLLLSPQGNRRHISFNTFVEQRISIEDPSGLQPGSSGTGSVIGSEDEADEEISSSTSSILEMRPAGARSVDRSLVVRSNSLSQEREHLTIAPIPPTLLKAAEELPAPSPAVVYAPPTGFDWDLTSGLEDSESSSSSLSGDGMSSGSGSVISDLAGFVPPQWGRPPVSVGAVGTGATGPAGPGGVTGDNIYSAAGYQEEQRRYHQAMQDEAQQKASSVIGMHAGRSKWVSGDVLKEAEEEEEEEEQASESEETGDSSAESTEDELGNLEPGVLPPAVSVVSSSTASSSTTSAPRTIVGGTPTSPPTTSGRLSARNASRPSKGILKNPASSSAAVTVGATTSDGSPALHSVPIGIPNTSVTHPPLQAPSTSNPFGTGNPATTNYFHMPPTATMSSPPMVANAASATPIFSSAGFLSPSQSDSIFSVSGAPPSTGRGRSTSRSASSSGVSDRSRSSSKISCASSPLGSVSPSGYGSPSGSRASSVLGNKRSSTDVGVIGRPVASSVGAGGRNGLGAAAVSVRQCSTSPPAVSSPLATGGILGSLPTSSLGTIVANVPLQTGVKQDSSVSMRPGPPLSRSGISASRSAASSNPRPGRTNSGSSISSSGSSGSVGTSSATARGKPNKVPVVSAAPATGAASLPLPVRKTSGPALLPNGEPRPTVVIAPKASTIGGLNSNASSEAPSPSGGQSIDTREAKLDEEMRKVKAAQAQKQVLKEKQSPQPDAGTEVTEAFVEHNLSSPTPSNSPIASFAALSLNPATPTKAPLKVNVPSPKSKAALSTAVVTPSSVTAPTSSSPAATADSVVGKNTDTIVSGAKGLLGAIWGGDGHAATSPSK